MLKVNANMKIAFLVDQENYRRYSPIMPIDWEILQFGNGAVDEEALIATNAQAILVDPMLSIPGAVLSRMPQLKIVHSFGVGYNQIDVAYAKSAGIYVCNNAGVNAVAVAEQAILLMLAILRKYHDGEAMVYTARQGEFKGRCFQNGLIELGECSVGLLGMGAIGKEVAKRLHGFGCQVFYFDPYPIQNPEDYHTSLRTKEEILSQCDIISLHMPVLPDTINMICEETIAQMKPGAVLINTSRGELVDQEAVCSALKDGRLGGFGADTLSPEPVQPDNPMLQLPEEIRSKMALSPHIGGITASTFYRSYVRAIKNMETALRGERPGNIVNGL